MTGRRRAGIDGTTVGKATTFVEDPAQPTAVDLQIGAYDSGGRAAAKTTHLADVVVDLR